MTTCVYQQQSIEARMGIILEHRISKKRFVLLGPAYGMAKSAYTDKRSISIKPILESHDIRLLSVADEDGRINWVSPDDYRVVYVDGMSPKEAIQDSLNNMTGQ